MSSPGLSDFGSRLRGVPAVAHLLADLDGDRYKPVKTNRPCTCRREINDSATHERPRSLIVTITNQASLVRVTLLRFLR